MHCLEVKLFLEAAGKLYVYTLHAARLQEDVCISAYSVTFSYIAATSVSPPLHMLMWCKDVEVIQQGVSRKSESIYIELAEV